MAVHTELDQDSIERLVAQFGFDGVENFEHATRGIENSNFFVQAASPKGTVELVVTLFESEPPEERFLVQLLEHLDRQGLRVPVPYRSEAGDAIVECGGRAAMLVKRFPGAHPDKPSVAECRQIGSFLARMHIAASPFCESANAHPRNSRWLQENAAQVSCLLDGKARVRLQEALDYVTALLARTDVLSLPVGVVHGDLFHDNALFEKGELCAVIDFHHAARHTLVFDLAVSLNDWAVDSEGQVVPELEQALMDGYQAVRRLSVAEDVYLAAFRVYAALSFWLSRLLQVKQLSGEVDGYLPEWRLDRLLASGRVKDPRWFEHLLNA